MQQQWLDNVSGVTVFNVSLMVSLQLINELVAVTMFISIAIVPSIKLCLRNGRKGTSYIKPLGTVHCTNDVEPCNKYSNVHYHILRNIKA